MHCLAFGALNRIFGKFKLIKINQFLFFLNLNQRKFVSIFLEPFRNTQIDRKIDILTYRQTNKEGQSLVEVMFTSVVESFCFPFQMVVKEGN